jgi:hypothetical protein
VMRVGLDVLQGNQQRDRGLESHTTTWGKGYKVLRGKGCEILRTTLPPSFWKFL